MKNDNNPKTIEVTDEQFVDDRPTEIPEITIEKTESGKLSYSKDVLISTRPVKENHTKINILYSVLAFICLILLAIWIFKDNLLGQDIPVSVSDSENISLLSTPYKAEASGTILNSDSILGVGMDLYSLKGLKASLETEMPDTADRSLILFMRSSDYHPDKSTIGTLIVDGKKMESKPRKERIGYMAISKDGKPVIGVSSSDRVADYVLKNNGSFFRQFILLSYGWLPKEFYLHGKVERSAIGRMNDGSLYYIVTHNKESMYDFADALREFGFVDALYITGGNYYTFNRDSVGNTHISEKAMNKIEKYTSNQIPAPFLVFRSN